MLKTILVASLLALTGCKILAKAPITHFYVINTQTGVCSVRKITNKNTLASERIAKVPLEQCDGIWGLSADEFAQLREYVKANN